MTNPYQYAANKGVAAQNQKAASDANKQFMDNYFKQQELDLKKQDLANKQKGNGLGSFKDIVSMATGLAALEKQGYSVPVTPEQLFALAGGGMQQPEGIEPVTPQQPQNMGQAQSMQPSFSGQQQQGMDGQQLPSNLTRQQAVDITGKVAEGKIVGAVELQNDLNKKLQEKQLTTKESRDVAIVSAQNVADNFVDFLDKQYELTGMKPGPLSGLVAHFQSLGRKNEFFEAFKGSLTEFAAQVGIAAIPSARAVRLIELFKGTAPTEFDSVESGVQQLVDSMRTAVARDMSINPKEYGFSSNAVSYDPDKGAITLNKDMISQLQDFEKTTKSMFLNKVKERRPELLRGETLDKMKSSNSDRVALAMSVIDELQNGGM